MATYNQQGLTAQGMGSFTEQQMKDRVLAQSQASPGTLQTGGQLGSTPLGPIPQSPVTFQAMTSNAQPDSNKPSNMPKGSVYNPATGQTTDPLSGSVWNGTNFVDSSTVPKSSPNVLTSQPAQSFVQDAKSNLEQQQADLQRSLSSFDVQAATQKQYEANKKKVEETFKPVEDATAENQASQMATAKAAEFYGGRSGTKYADAALAHVQTVQQRELDELQKKKSEAMAQAWDSALGGNVANYQKLEQQTQDIQQDIQKAQEKAQVSQKEILQVQEADSKEGGAIYSLVRAGKEPTEVQLQALDEIRNYRPGTSRMLFDAEKSDFDRTQAKDQVELQSKSIGAAKALSDFLDSQPTGQPVNVGGTTYIATGRGTLKTGVEVDKNTGIGMAYSYDPTTGRTTTTPMGQVGFNDPNWEIKQDDQGRLWRVSKNQGTMQQIGQGSMIAGEPVSLPMTPGPTQKTNAAVFPDGTRGPALPGHEVNAGECGAAWNYWAGSALLGPNGNSLSGKIQALSKFPKVEPSNIQSHDTIIMKGGTSGHILAAGDVYNDPTTGKEMITCTESNYVPPGQGLLSHTRVMAADDPRIALICRVPLPNLPPSGSDSSVTMQASGAPTFGLKTASTKDEILSPTEAQTLGVPYGTTKTEAASKNITPQKTPKPPSASEQKALNFYSQAKNAADVLEQLEPQIEKLGFFGQERLKYAPNVLQDQLGQDYNQAQRQFTEARLRAVSGAAIASSEYEKDALTYFPQPGDSQKTLERKKNAREAVLNGLKNEAGNAYAQQYGEETNSSASTPSQGQTQVLDGVTYKWNGKSWES